MKKTKPESEIIAGLHISDPQVFEHIFNSFYTELVYFSLRFTDNRQESEDIVIETFQKFWERRNVFFTIANIKGFLYVTVRNTSFNYIRLNYRSQKRTKELEYYLSGNLEKDTELAIIETDVVTKLYHHINTLPSKCKRVFKLKYFDGLSTSEIADKLKISEHTVRNHIAYSIKLLRIAISSQLLMLSLLYLTGMQNGIHAEYSFPDYSAPAFFDVSFLEFPHEELTIINN